MTHEEVMDWLMIIMSWCLHLICLCAMVLVLGFGAGYLSEPASNAKDPRCINAACETKCKDGARFVRHQGCTP